MPVVTVIGKYVKIAGQNCMMPRAPGETQVEIEYWY